MIVVVLGMHKSGTTLLAEMLHKSGIDMVETAPSSGYDGGNKYERESTNLYNKRLLGKLSHKSVSAIHKPTRVTQLGLNEMSAIIDECRSRNPESWGFKDPRTVMTYDEWAKVLPPHVVVAVYRHYHEVLRHYSKKSRRQLWSLNPYTRTYRVLRAWTIYNQRLVDIVTEMTGKAVLLSYEALMTDDQEFRRLQNVLNRNLVDVRDKSLYRSNRKVSRLSSAIEPLISSRLGNAPNTTLQALDRLRAEQLQSEESLDAGRREPVLGSSD